MNQTKSNVGKIVIVVVGVLLICALCFFTSVASSEKNNDVYSNSNDTSGTDITSQAQAESNSISEDEKGNFVDIDVNTFTNMYNQADKKVVLFSRPTCGYCQIAEPILQNMIYKYNIEINHVNTDEMSEDDFTTLTNTNSIFEEFGTPLLVVVSNGEVSDSVNGLTNTDGYLEFFKKNGFINE